MVNIVIVAIFILSTLLSPKQIVQRYLNLQDNHCLSALEVPQDFFTDVRFYDVGNQCLSDVPPLEPREAIYLAIDTAGRVYSVFGQDSSTLDKLIERYPLQLTKREIRDYGWFIVAMTRTGTWEEYHQMTNLKKFLAMNREIFSAHAWTASLKEWKRMERRTIAVCDTLDLNRVYYDTSAGRYESDHYIWYRLGGVVERVRLSISTDGMWEIISDTLVADKIGCWTNLIY